MGSVSPTAAAGVARVVSAVEHAAMHAAQNGLQRVASATAAVADDAIAAVKTGGRAGWVDALHAAELPPIFDHDVLRGVWSGSFGEGPLTAFVPPSGVAISLTTGAQDGAPIIADARATVAGVIKSSDGKHAGTFSRTVTWQPGTKPVVDHSYLELHEEFQGTGFSKAFNNHAFEHYKQLGVEKTTIHAALSVGGYAWARQGFELSATGAKNQTQAAVSRALQVRDLVDNAFDAHLITFDEAWKLADRVADFDDHIPANAITTVRELADEGEIGRRVLLGNHWHGERPV